MIAIAKFIEKGKDIFIRKSVLNFANEMKKAILADLL